MMGVLHQSRGKGHAAARTLGETTTVSRAAKQLEDSAAIEQIHDISQRPQFSGLSGELGGASSLFPIQAKLTIGQPNDRYEQEADWVASQVVQQINVPASVQSSLGQSVQRTEAPCEEGLQAKPENTSLQRMEAIAGGEASTNLESAIYRARGGGKPLDAGLQQSMGQAMRADFSGVKVHTDAQSDQLNQSIQAKAFTTGQDVFFRQGEYKPGTRGGQELIAHELTHVVQQEGRAVMRSSLPLQQIPQYRDTENQRIRENKFYSMGNISRTNQTVLQLRWIEQRQGGGLKYWQPSPTDSIELKKGWYRRGFNGWDEPQYQESETDQPLGQSDSQKIDEPYTANHVLETVTDGEIEGMENGRNRQGAISEKQLSEAAVRDLFNNLIKMADQVDEIISLFTANETEVSQLLNRAKALNAAQIALNVTGIVFAGAGVAFTGGLLVIPIILAGIGYALGTAQGYTEAGLDAGLQIAKGNEPVPSGEKRKETAKSLAKGAPGMASTVKDVYHASSSSSSVVSGAGGFGGGLLGVLMGGHGLFKKSKINSGLIWSRMDWELILHDLKNAVKYSVIPYRATDGSYGHFSAMVERRLGETVKRVEAATQRQNKK